MASFASEVSGTQMVEFFGRFGRFGGDMAKLQKLLGNDRVMAAWVKQLDELQLIHGVFSLQEDVLVAFKVRCAAKGIDFGKFSWVGSKQAPEFDPNDPETVVVLDATLNNLQNTFDFSWEWTADGQHDMWRSTEMLSGANKLRLLSDDREDGVGWDGPEFRPYTLRWVRIKLDTNVGKKPIDVRNPKSSPGCALLFMSAEHPAWIKTLDYKGHKKRHDGFWLPGLKCTQPDEKRWRSVPYVTFCHETQQVALSADLDVYDHEPTHLAIPILLE